MIELIVKIPVPNLSQPVRQWQYGAERRGSERYDGVVASYKEQPTKLLGVMAYPKNILTEEVLSD